VQAGDREVDEEEVEQHGAFQVGVVANIMLFSAAR
jgi:hypothetical protein